MWTCHALGDRCLTWRCAEGISVDASRQVLSVFRDWKQAGIPGVLDVVPAYTEVAVHFDPLTISGEALRKDLEVRLSSDRSFLENDAIGGAVHRIPVVYNGADLERVAAHTGYSVPDVTHRHAAGEYIVAMVGFLPHFPYCLGLDPTLNTPRLSSPRTRVPAGSVALAGAQTGVYPCESPGGWNLLGQTDPALLEPVCPGDVIRFEAVEAMP